MVFSKQTGKTDNAQDLQIRTTQCANQPLTGTVVGSDVKVDAGHRLHHFRKEG